MTSTGLILLPLGLVVMLLPWRYSFPTLMVFATMKSAAVLNAGAFGLQPGYFMALLMIGRTVVELLLLRHPLDARVLKLLTPLICFVMVCFVATWIGLAFFQGKVMVISSTVGLNLDLVQPYQLQRQNFTQLFYILLNVALVYVLAHQLARMPAREALRVLERSVVLAILFASLVAFWELAAFHTGLPFADRFFHSNAGYGTAYGQVLSGTILRVSGSFSEPSAVAYFYAGALCFAWYYYIAMPGLGRMALVLVCLAVMAISTSTTAFLFIGIFVPVMLKDIPLALARAGRETRLVKGHLRGALVLGVGAFAMAAFALANWSMIDDVLTRMLFEKSQTSSFEQRSSVDLMAFDIVLDTSLIGIGLGGHRPNNLAMTLLSNTGVAGFLMFAAFAFNVLRPRPGAGTAETIRPAEIRPFRWLVLGFLAVHALSNPNLNPIVLWIGFGFAIGLVVQAEQVPAQRAVSPSAAVGRANMPA